MRKDYEPQIPYTEIWFVTYLIGNQHVCNGFAHEIDALRSAANVYSIPDVNNLRVFRMHVEIKQGK